jgi:hypothetical protein
MADNYQPGTELGQLRSEAAAIGRRIDELEAAEREKRLRPYVGRFFRLQNNYSCPPGPEDYWWLYQRIDGVDDFSLTGFQFQRDNASRFSAERTGSIYVREEWEEITAEQWAAAWWKFLDGLIAEAGRGLEPGGPSPGRSTAPAAAGGSDG